MRSMTICNTQDTTGNNNHRKIQEKIVQILTMKWSLNCYYCTKLLTQNEKNCLVLVEAACQHTKWILSSVRRSANKMLFSAQRIANTNKILSSVNFIWLSCAVFIVSVFFWRQTIWRRTRCSVLLRLWMWMWCANVGVIWYMHLGELSMLCTRAANKTMDAFMYLK